MLEDSVGFRSDGQPGAGLRRERADVEHEGFRVEQKLPVRVRNYVSVREAGLVAGSPGNDALQPDSARPAGASVNGRLTITSVPPPSRLSIPARPGCSGIPRAA